MRVYKLDTNTVKITLDKVDLAERSLDIKDMVYGNEKTANFFAEMLTTASDMITIKPGTPVAVEAVPLKDGDIELTITKIDSPDELDSRFSKFSPLKGEEGTPSFYAALDHAFDRLKEELKMSAVKGMKDINTTKTLDIKNTNDIVCITEFDDLDKVSEACKNKSFYDYVSTLYKNEKMNKYYLVLSLKGERPKELEAEFVKVCNTLAEYGTRINANSLSEAYYNEHHKVIVPSDAVEKLSKI